MAITLLNDFAPGDVNFTTMMNTINKAYKGMAEISITNYDGTGAPDVKVGSVFENNGALFIVDTSDITPTGYAGIANSTTFYIYYDEDPGAFIFSSTAPSWNDALQGWYNANDRAFFSMFKDSGGTLYENKNLLLTQNNLEISNNLTLNGGIDAGNSGVYFKTKVLEIGDWNMDTTVSVTLVHGVGDVEKIRSIGVIIRPDTGIGGLGYLSTVTAGTSTIQGGISSITDTQITLGRLTGGLFDGASFNATSYNRGWVTLTYEV